MFMICIAIEMAQKAFQSDLESIFVPERIEYWESCTNSTDSSIGIFRLFSGPTDPAFDSLEVAWYCHAPYTILQSAYIYCIRFINYHGLFCMTFILFLDVFVNFFVGKYDTSGFLVANSFVPRWIFPGIGFQLLVNPIMKDVSALVKSLLHEPGPARVWLWIIAFAIPISTVVLNWLKWNVWMVLVSVENKKTSGFHKSKQSQRYLPSNKRLDDR